MIALIVTLLTVLFAVASISSLLVTDDVQDIVMIEQ